MKERARTTKEEFDAKFPLNETRHPRPRRKRKVVIILRHVFDLRLLLWLLPLVATPLWAAAPGELDQAFASGGVLNLRMGPLGASEWAHTVAVQKDGRILIGGYQNTAYGLARVHRDGTLDPTFGVGGFAVPPQVELGQFAGIAMVLQSDGRIIEGGAYFSAVRHETNGVRDLDFGFTGRARIDWPYAAGSFDLLIQADDKIVFGGYVQVTGGQEPMQDIALVRYNADGTPDGSFGNGGILTTDLGDRIDRCMRVAIQRDGKIVAAGYAANFGATNRWMLVRYATNGTLDMTFGANGKVTAMPAHGSLGEIPYALAVQADGKILLGGVQSDRFVLLRFNTDGTADTTFGVNGKVLTQAGTRYSSCRTIGLQRNGKIVAAGHAESSFALVRYETNGELDIHSTVTA
jgi:uncharacterized delta-60 repeat protein